MALDTSIDSPIAQIAPGYRIALLHQSKGRLQSQVGSSSAQRKC